MKKLFIIINLLIWGFMSSAQLDSSKINLFLQSAPHEKWVEIIKIKNNTNIFEKLEEEALKDNSFILAVYKDTIYTASIIKTDTDFFYLGILKISQTGKIQYFKIKTFSQNCLVEESIWEDNRTNHYPQEPSLLTDEEILFYEINRLAIKLTIDLDSEINLAKNDIAYQNLLKSFKEFPTYRIFQEIVIFYD